LQVVPEVFQAWFAWNPLAYLVAGYRAALLEGQFLWQAFAGLLGLASGLLGAALWLFQRLLLRARYVL
jgi:lipopolysaccharide transport system permease protein